MKNNSNEKNVSPSVAIVSVGEHETFPKKKKKSEKNKKQK